ncbi:MAG: NAD(P)H-dependent oxidoreductase subunit E [Herbinix sp.]|nr:NAD(P)H-dependent oxidoreductase subunit E [Herbinix sp.]
MNIYVCIGSSCHQKSSYSVMKEIKYLIIENGLEEKVNLQSAFCLGHCANGITIKIDDEIVTGVGMGNIREIFKTKVLDICK